MPAKYYLQQGQLWVAYDREWNDFMSFHPEFPTFHVRTYPDYKVFKALDTVKKQSA